MLIRRKLDTPDEVMAYTMTLRDTKNFGIVGPELAVKNLKRVQSGTEVQIM